MKEIKAVILAATMAGNAFAGDPYAEQIGGILQDAGSTNCEIRLEATNRIDSLIAVLSNRCEIATCKLLKAKLRIECADITGPEEIYDYAAFDDSTNLCWSVLNEFSNERTHWQFYGAAMLLPLPLSIDSRFDDMFRVATNALSSANTLNSVSFETNVWQALFGQNTLSAEDAQTSFRSLAASSLLLLDRNADISAYTNGLPAQALDVIRSIRSDSEE